MSYILIGILTFCIAILSPFYAIIMPFLPEEQPEIKTVTFDGVTYKNCFIDEKLFIIENFNFHGEEADYGEDFYKITDNIIYKGHTQTYSDTFGISEFLYCTEEDWEALKTFYADPDNFNYYCRTYTNSYSQAEKKQLESVLDGNIFRQILGEAKDVREDSYSYVTTIPRDDERKTIEFVMESKDGLFYADSIRYVVYEGTVYHEYDYTADEITNKHTVYKLKGEYEEFISETLKNNGYETLFE